MNRFLAVSCLALMTLAAHGTARADDYSGPYVGLAVGPSNGRANARTSTVFVSSGYFASSSIDPIAAVGAQGVAPTGFAVSGNIGYNLQKMNLVYGAEADFGFMRASSVASGSGPYPCCTGKTFTVTQQAQTNWLMTARPRIGYTYGRMLMYGTGGMALTRLRYHELFTDTFASAQESAAASRNIFGWTVGGGAEYQANTRWSVKAEYIYASFGRQTATSTNLTATTPPGSFPANMFTHSADLHMHIVRFGFNARF